MDFDFSYEKRRQFKQAFDGFMTASVIGMKGVNNCVVVCEISCIIANKLQKVYRTLFLVKD